MGVQCIKRYTEEKITSKAAGVDDRSAAATDAGKPLCPLPWTRLWCCDIEQTVTSVYLDSKRGSNEDWSISVMSHPDKAGRGLARHLGFITEQNWSTGSWICIYGKPIIYDGWSQGGVVGCTSTKFNSHYKYGVMGNWSRNLHFPYGSI